MGKKSNMFIRKSRDPSLPQPTSSLGIESWADKWVFIIIQISHLRLAKCLFMMLLMDLK